MDGEIWAWGAAETAAAIRRRDVSAREVAEAALARIAAVNPAVNALPEVLEAEALAAADAADRALASGEETGALCGVPVTVKINVDQAGTATTNGLAALADNIAAEDSPPVANLRRAGAVIVGRSNTPAMSLRWFTDNALHGRTLNPWDPGVTPGGSSGGAAAALATGMGAIGHGNDYGGSIRHPAAMCGVVGLRPSSGRVPAYNATQPAERPISAQLMSVQGPLARSVADAALALEAMIAPDPRDPFHRPAPLARPSPETPLRVALLRAPAGGGADPEVSAALDRAAGWLREAGWEVEEAAPESFDEAAALWRALVYEDVRRTSMAAVEASGDAALRKNLAHVFAGMERRDGDAVLDLYADRLRIARDWSLFLERHPVLLTAVSWRHGMAVDADIESPEAFERVIAAQAPLLGTAMLGLPGLSVPTGLARGLPAGAQLVGRWFREDQLLAAGAVIEAGAGTLTPIDPRG